MINSKLQSYRSKLIKKIEDNLNSRPFENGPELRFLHDHKVFTPSELAIFIMGLRTLCFIYVSFYHLLSLVYFLFYFLEAESKLTKKGLTILEVIKS